MKDHSELSAAAIVIFAVAALVAIAAWQINAYSECKVSGGIPVRGAFGFECIYNIR
jgi:hypothetical protein